MKRTMIVLGLCLFTLLPNAHSILNVNTQSWEGEKDTDNNFAISSKNKILGLKFTFNEGQWVRISKKISLSLSPRSMLHLKMKLEGPVREMSVLLQDVQGEVVESKIPLPENASLREYKISLSNFKPTDPKKKKIINWSEIKRIAFIVMKAKEGEGKLDLSQIYFQEITWSAPDKQKSFDWVAGDPKVAEQAANWIAKQQNPSALTVSFENDRLPYAWLKDQAMALLVFSRSEQSRGKRLIKKLGELQREDGSWPEGLILDTGKEIVISPKNKTYWRKSEVPGVLFETNSTDLAANAWVLFAISQYKGANYESIIIPGLRYLVGLRNSDGGLDASSEANFLTWWVFNLNDEKGKAATIRDYIIAKLWRPEEGRFIASTKNFIPKLTPQTIGSIWSSAVELPEYGLQSLAFARKYLACKTLDRRTTGFDSQGPHTVWNEGAAQYVVGGGTDANKYLKDINKQQREDGALQHSHEEYSVAGAWHSTMYGLAPTAWLFLANSNQTKDIFSLKVKK